MTDHDGSGPIHEYPQGEVHVHCDHMPEACCWCGVGLETHVEARWQEEHVPRSVWRGPVDVP